MRATIKAKVIASFIVVLGLLGFSAWMAISSLQSVNDSATELVEVYAERVNIANDIRKDLLKIQQTEQEVFLSSDPEENRADIETAKNLMAGLREHTWTAEGNRE
jgi:CHASE3 domain sensor protein